ncbi:YigZ family protein [Veillonella criceti]|uniref:IMPACT family member yigZ n=1 Tax=Veillonella criceti TaxID=103891 RepID=A0A380NKR4_9FIRM|nr:YigZ family protein [Veillonella criceti]SUP42117.1 IMPACT family member yigZ [Veillonella criceti]
MESYITISEEHRIEYIVEKSRFIATAIPCTTEVEAQAAIARITKEFWDATHNCTAYALGPRQEQQRSSDNGEPSGTAGKPMLEVLKKTGITNTLIVVTRYFGGIKLGAGGLIRAYSHSAAEVIHNAPKTLHAPRQLVAITIDYGLYGAVERYLQDENYYYETNFTDTVTITIYVEPKRLTQLETRLANLTSGQHNWTLLDEKLVALPYTDTSN